MNRTMNICPYLGMAEDVATNTSFPSLWNHCHNSKPVEVVEFTHQHNYCLTENYKTCPVYLRVMWSEGKKKPLPSSLRVPRNQLGNKQAFNWKIIPLSLLILAFLFFAGFRLFLSKQAITSTGMLTSQARFMELTAIAQAGEVTATQTPPIPPTETQSDLIIAINAALTQTAFALTEATATPTITLTNTPTPKKVIVPPTAAPSKPKPTKKPADTPIPIPTP